MWRGVAKTFLAFAFGVKQKPKHWPRCALSGKMETTCCGFGKETTTIVVALHRNKYFFVI
jgi:hypothetical protein